MALRQERYILTVSKQDYRKIMQERGSRGSLALTYLVLFMTISTAFVFIPLNYFEVKGFEQIKPGALFISAIVGFLVFSFVKILFDVNYPKLLDLLAKRGYIAKPVKKEYDFRSVFTDIEKEVYLKNGWDGKTNFHLRVQN